MISKSVTISNMLGLHARAAAVFVKIANRFVSDVKIRRDETIVNGKSIMGVLMLAAAKGTQIEIITNGEDESTAMDALVELVNNKFGEDR